MANIYASASVDGILVFEDTYKPSSGASRNHILLQARYAIEQFISIRYNLSDEGEDLIFDTMNEDEELLQMTLGYSESWISKDGLVTIVVALEEDGD